VIRLRSAAAALAAVAPLMLVGCPIPQPLPTYPPGQPVTPPRIVVDDTVHMISPLNTIVRVAAGCPDTAKPMFPLDATLRHELTNETVSARWFVDYDPTNQDRSKPVVEDEIPAPSSSATSDPTLRTVPTYPFSPYDFAAVAGTGSGGDARTAGALHVVELVVSNGFDPAADVPPQPSGPALPYRTPLLNFEVQVFRWVFVTTTPSAAGCTGSACVLCPGT
jgi:hypothetical protein